MQARAEPPASRASRRGCLAIAIALLAALTYVSLALAPGAATAARPLSLGILDGLFRSIDPAVRQQWLGRTSSDGAELALTIVSWRGVAPAAPDPDFDATDPADPGYDWGTLDETVREAQAKGLEVAITVTSAPDWAEGSNRAPNAPPGTWKPEPDDLAAFATALAQRYSGAFSDPDASVEDPPLPRVGYYQVWAEANLSTRLSPQWGGAKGKRPPRPRSPKIYRAMLNAFYGAVKRVDPSMRVISTGTAPYGDPPGGRRMRPLAFWRQMLCLRGPKLRAARCRTKARFDVFAHHPINTSGAPSKAPINPNDISSANLGDLVDALRKAERAKRVRPPGRRPVWVTEFWYRSNPPDGQGLGPAKQASYIAESLFLFWRAGAELAINLRVRDAESTEDPEVNPAGTGLYYADGRAKPAARAFRFPFVAERLRPRRVGLWGKAPEPGKVLIERRRNHRWRPLVKLRAGANRIFTGRARVSGQVTLRASTGDGHSPPWPVTR